MGSEPSDRPRVATLLKTLALHSAEYPTRSNIHKPNCHRIPYHCRSHQHGQQEQWTLHTGCSRPWWGRADSRALQALLGGPKGEHEAASSLHSSPERALSHSRALHRVCTAAPIQHTHRPARQDAPMLLKRPQLNSSATRGKPSTQPATQWPKTTKCAWGTCTAGLQHTPHGRSSRGSSRPGRLSSDRDQAPLLQQTSAYGCPSDKAALSSGAV